MKAKAISIAVIMSSSAALAILPGAEAGAAAFSCNWNPSQNTDSYGTMKGAVSNTWHLYKGPSTSCGKTGVSVAGTASIRVRCETSDTPSGNAWMYITVGSGSKGWTSASNVNGYSTFICY